MGKKRAILSKSEVKLINKVNIDDLCLAIDVKVKNMVKYLTRNTSMGKVLIAKTLKQVDVMIESIVKRKLTEEEIGLIKKVNVTQMCDVIKLKREHVSKHLNIRTKLHVTDIDKMLKYVKEYTPNTPNVRVLTEGEIIDIRNVNIVKMCKHLKINNQTVSNCLNNGATLAVDKIDKMMEYCNGGIGKRCFSEHEMRFIKNYDIDRMSGDLNIPYEYLNNYLNKAESVKNETIVKIINYCTNDGSLLDNSTNGSIRAFYRSVKMSHRRIAMNVLAEKYNISNSVAGKWFNGHVGLEKEVVEVMFNIVRNISVEAGGYVMKEGVYMNLDNKMQKEISKHMTNNKITMNQLRLEFNVTYEVIRNILVGDKSIPIEMYDNIKKYVSSTDNKTRHMTAAEMHKIKQIIKNKKGVSMLSTFRDNSDKIEYGYGHFTRVLSGVTMASESYIKLIISLIDQASSDVCQTKETVDISDNLQEYEETGTWSQPRSNYVKIKKSFADSVKQLNEPREVLREGLILEMDKQRAIYKKSLKEYEELEKALNNLK